MAGYKLPCGGCFTHRVAELNITKSVGSKTNTKRYAHRTASWAWTNQNPAQNDVFELRLHDKDN